MRYVVTIDSRVSDAAGLCFMDLSRDQVHLFVQPNDGTGRRRGFRGGCWANGLFYCCTSCEIKAYELAWPPGGAPSVTLRRTLRRPEWLWGLRANADLHHLCYEPSSQCLLVAASFLDSVDRVALDGTLLRRTHLWDMAPDLMDLAFQRREGLADLCHVNHILAYGDDHLLTLGNLNGTRQGGVISCQTGRVLAGGLAFPHDGCLLPDGRFALTEAESSMLVLYAGVPNGLPESSVTCTRSPVFGSESERHKRKWVRGLASGDGLLLVGCSRFYEKTHPPEADDVTHVRVLDSQSFRCLAEIAIPSQPGFDLPVIYSIVPWPVRAD